MMSWLNKPLLGVDLGNRTIKGLRLKKARGRVVLDGYFFHDLAQTSESYPERPNTEDTLKAGIELQELKRQRFAASIPDHEVLHMMLDLPQLKPAELRTAVRHELSEHTGIAVEELAFDFKILPSKKSEKSANLVTVSAYGIRRKVVDDLVDVLASASLLPAVVEPDTLAIHAMLEFNDYVKPEGAYVVFDLGERHLTATLLSEGEIKLSKSTQNGMGKINAALMEALKISYADAETRKRTYNFNAYDQAEQQAGLIIDEGYAAIFSDAKEAMELFRQHSPEAFPIQQILLVGGGSQTSNIEKVFEMFFRAPAVVVNPFRNIDIFSGNSATSSANTEIGALAPFMAAAVGSALGQLAQSKVRKS